MVEGRDIGTVVFPDAPVKVFLTADDDVRAARRRRDEAAAGPRRWPSTWCRTRSPQRDRADASLGRALRPEDAAPDAMVVDTSDSTVDEVVAEIVARVQAAERTADEGTP